ncbi:transcription factor LBX1b [Astyanax mexicanus]|uniref:Transcription factor LBX1-like n=2 Tax=Astyanax mexicanus TaxID=7994 RepID=A0A8B9JNB0_ASTMX|nr:transcription factor LBX1b [Astyanax mexicanus]KAG9262575.1 transcription factor LBX1-like [Astyanax mexicanus]
MASTEVLRVYQVIHHKTRMPRSSDHVPPKPLTPFSIADILSKPSIKPSIPRVGTCRGVSWSVKVRGRSSGTPQEPSALSALQELTNNTFRAMELVTTAAPPAGGKDELALVAQRIHPKKRRKARTAFTNHQLCELEKRFLFQRYLSPADRDRIAQQLGLTNAQVITWFQNRRAKLKRDLDEMRADVESTRALGSTTALPDLQRSGDGARGPSGPEAPETSQLDHGKKLAHKLSLAPALAFSDHTSQHSSGEHDDDDDDEDDAHKEDEDVEIDVDD